jgi:hypothetical protein
MKSIIKLALGVSLVIGLLPMASANAVVHDVNLAVGGDGEIFPFAAGETALLSWDTDGDTVEVYVDGVLIGTFGGAGDSVVLAGNDFPKPVRAEDPTPTNTNNLGQILNRETISGVEVEVVDLSDASSDSVYVDVSRGYEVSDTNRRTATLATKGRNFSGIVNGGCDFKVGKIGLRGDCREGGDRARVFYRLGRPALASGEFTTGHSLSTVIWDGGDGSTHNETTLNGGKRVRVRLLQDFLGQIRRVRVAWSIDANDSVVEV